MRLPITFLIDSMEEVKVKNKIKIFRAMHNLTQEQLADEIGVSRQTVNAIESDKYLPSLGLAFRIAKLFKVSIEEIFIFDEKEKNYEN